MGANRRLAFVLGCIIAALVGDFRPRALAGDPQPLPTTLDNFFLPGTQPDATGLQVKRFVSETNCSLCHAIIDPPEFEVPIKNRWAGSMMANAARDPLFKAALAIANQDAAFAGDLCLRCHTPIGWLEGRSVPTDGSALIAKDFEGVSCNFCHRMVDPDLDPDYDDEPAGDAMIRQALLNAGLLPIRPGSAGYVVDPNDSRRGPYPYVPFEEGGMPPAVTANFHTNAGQEVPIIHSPFHTTGQFCGTCHDVSNPAFTRQPDGSFALNPAGTEHPTGDPYDMFPVERTFSEWAASAYASMGVDAFGVFGGNHATGVMRTCQDCHMPDSNNFGCAFTDYRRPDLPAHDFNGGNTWIPQILLNLYPKELQPEFLLAGIDRARYMLQNAATMEVEADACSVNVRVINETGHKLPSGYPEGRRMWLEVEFLDANLSPVVIRGDYNGITADLITSDTKVYEAELGVDAAMGAIADLPAGPSFHFALNNKYYKDNRIPPRGFTNAAFEAIGAAPVGTVYADGQYWDDTAFRVPQGAISARVRLYYQTAAREYIEFLRDENRTNDAGDVLYEQWELTGKSPPELMLQATVLNLAAGLFGDADCSGHVDLDDHALLFDCLSGPVARLTLGCEALDSDLDGATNLRDFAEFQNALSGH